MTLAVFLAVWHVVWPVVTTIATVLAGLWALLQAWPFIRRTFAVTDIVAQLPEQLAELKRNDDLKLKAIAEVKAELKRADDLKLKAIAEVKSTLDEHIEATKVGTAEWDDMKDGLRTLLVNQQKVIYEVQHNGGGSIKDDIAVIKSAVTAGKEEP